MYRLVQQLVHQVFPWDVVNEVSGPPLVVQRVGITFHDNASSRYRWAVLGLLDSLLPREQPLRPFGAAAARSGISNFSWNNPSGVIWESAARRSTNTSPMASRIPPYTLSDDRLTSGLVFLSENHGPVSVPCFSEPLVEVLRALPGSPSSCHVLAGGSLVFILEENPKQGMARGIPR